MTMRQIDTGRAGMKLLRLIVQGFKSFADRTEISFADGMTAVVGPNGCGKSNISDAVRWVLGEQNIRQLRGQRAEDIIFAGSLGRKARNGAEVTLVLDNAAREFPLDTAEVSVRRRFLRNGDSDFFINGRTCRLKDIQELFANTGLGRGSLAIIGQNRVDQVLSAKPEERRLIFEEVAGISRYRLRKEEGLLKLKRTKENMDRLRDLTSVLREQLEPLAAAAEKAKQFQTLMEEKKAIEATASLLKLTAVRRMLARYETGYRDLSDERNRCSAALAELDAKLAAEDARGEVQAAAYRKAAEKTAALIQEMERLHGDYRVKEAECQRGREELQRISEMLDEKRRSAAQLEAEEAQALQNTADARARLEAAVSAIARAEEEKRTAEALYQSATGSRMRREKEWQETCARRDRLLLEKDHLESGLEEARSRKTALAGEIQQIRETQDAAAVKIAASQKEEQERSAALVRLERQGKEERQSLEAGLREADRLLRLGNEMQAKLAAVRSRLAYLERAEKEYASFSGVTKTLLSSREPWRPHILGALGDLLEIPSVYTEAAEAALGGAISHLVTDTAEAAGGVIQWMKKNHAGRTTFYPLDAMRPRYADHLEKQAAREEGICGVAADLFGCAPRFETIKQALLGRILIAEDLAAARRIAARYHYRLHLVTLDGQIIRPGGSMTGGSMRKRENTFFGRKREIGELRAEAEAISQERDRLLARKSEQDEKNQKCSQAVERTREAWQALHVEAAAAKARNEGQLREAAESQAALEKAEAGYRQQEERIREKEKARTDLAGELDKIGDLPPLLPDESVVEAGKRADEARGYVASCMVDRAHAEEAALRSKAREEDIAAALAAARGHIEELRQEKQRWETGWQAAKEEMDRMSGRFEKLRKDREDAERERDALRQETDHAADRRKHREKERRDRQDQMVELSRRLTEMEVRVAEEKRLETEETEKLGSQGLTEAAAEAFRIPGNGEAMAKKLASVKAAAERLGPVNPQAGQEYEAGKARLAGYETQLDDLEKAESGLAAIIREIDTAMAADFTAAFGKINEEFHRVIRIMFQGGNGRLELTEPDKPLECGVELYLDLPGKKRQPLTLMSGGERALTVIALLISFLTYRPAPFCFVDEIDAALDDANVERFGRMIGEYKKRTQFIVITHRKKSMEFADTLQGVTMGEKGVSSLVTVRMDDYVEPERT